MLQLFFGALCLASAVAHRPALAAAPVASVRLYAIDCGRIHVSDMGAFADTGELDGKPRDVVAPCFLVRHPKGTLLWDTGLSDKLAAGGSVRSGIFELSVQRGLVDQLKQIDLGPADVDYLAFSHLHFDHTGNANAFAAATWIVNKDELAWASAEPALNVGRADSLASIDRIERIVKNTTARFIVQHDVQDFETLPRFPAFLE